jgi:hypothetical protein
VLEKSRELQQPTLHLEQSAEGPFLHLRPLRDFAGARKARERQLRILVPQRAAPDTAASGEAAPLPASWTGTRYDTLALGPWSALSAEPAPIGLRGSFPGLFAPPTESDQAPTPLRVEVRFRGAGSAGAAGPGMGSKDQAGRRGAKGGTAPPPTSSWIGLDWPADAKANAPWDAPPRRFGARLGLWLFWLTGMVGFWATMSLSIADITRYARSQEDQIQGQFLGLPGTMVAYSFVGIFATCAALGLFADVLIAEDAPWDPASLLARFEKPGVVILAQLSLLVATLSTNIAANVIAPANAFANLAPHRISFRIGGLLAAGLGVLLMPWWLVDRIAPALLVISAFFGPILGVMLADYWVLRRQRLDLDGLYRVDGPYRFQNGYHRAALWALALGTLPTLLGYLIPALSVLYDGSWFIGFTVAFVAYPRFARTRNRA